MTVSSWKYERQHMVREVLLMKFSFVRRWGVESDIFDGTCCGTLRWPRRRWQMAATKQTSHLSSISEYILNLAVLRAPKRRIDVVMDFFEGSRRTEKAEEVVLPLKEEACQR